MPRHVLALAFLMCTFAAACAVDYDPANDGGFRDALFVDRPSIDGMTDADASVDGGVFDATTDGPPSACLAPSCDPRSPRACSATPSSACLLENEGTVCAPMVGGGREGDACVLDGDCGATLACLASRTGGVCARVCCAADAFSCGSSDMRCDAPSTLVGGGTSEWGHCVAAQRPCDVIAQDMCDPGDACYIASGVGETDCRPAGSTTVGETCVNVNDCAPTLVCTGVGVKKCAQICDIDEPTSCASQAGTSCRAYAYSPAGTGVCTVPVASAS